MKTPKRPRDPNQLAKNIVDIAIGDTTEIDINNGKNINAVRLGRLGGLIGGKARAEKLSKEKRLEIAKLGSMARWKKK